MLSQICTVKYIKDYETSVVTEYINMYKTVNSWVMTLSFIAREDFMQFKYNLPKYFRLLINGG